MAVALSKSASTSVSKASTQTPGPASVSVALGHPAYKQLSRLAEAHSASRQNTGLALITVLLFRYTGAAVLTFAARDREADERTNQVLRLELTDRTTFSSILLQLQRCALFVGGLPKSQRPTSKRGRARHSRTEIIVHSDGMCDLLLRFEHGATDLNLRIDYPVGALPPLHSEDLSDQIRRLLDHYALAPDASLRAPTLLSDAAAKLLPNPRASLASPSFQFAHEAFLAWAERTPDAIAVRSAGRDWTYAQLADNSRTLARCIAARVEPGDTVAVSGMRSFELVSAMLAVWRRGAVLLTIDPKLPRARRQRMVEQARVRLLLDIGSPGVSDLNVPHSLRLCSDDDASAFRIPSPEQSHDVESDAEANPADRQDTAYVFFTSGSTGTPKAVLGSHRGLAHFLVWQRETFAIRPTDRAAQLTGLSFDVVLRDMFLPLTSGACLCIPGESDVVDGSRLLPWLAAQRISVLHAVPSLAMSWLEHAPDDADFSALRQVFFAGEPLMEGFVQRFRNVFGSQSQLVNLYGPTETTLAKCYHVVGDEPEPNVQPVGQPISHTQALILDRERRLCGLNEPGEIAIRTPFRSLGYLDQPEATARAFIANPFGSDSADLIYLTGDLGRYRHDGCIDILGRADGQLKLRGVRVELGEIEATLLLRSDVAAAAVIAREGPDGGKSLWAYVVPRSEASPSLTTELRAYLQTQLPAALIPHHFVRLATLPLTANGKLDRAALLARTDVATAASHVEPTSARERELVAQWSAILQVPTVSTDASFYELGGDSLTAMRVMLRMRVFGFDDATCQALLQGKTIAQIANPIALGVGPPCTRSGFTPHERMRLLLHALRGLLVLVMLTDHYLLRLREQWLWAREAEASLLDFFRFTTPSFAIVFGLSLGFVYYPLFLRQRAQAQALLWRNALFVGVAGILMVIFSSRAFESWQLTYVVPLFWYYALAFTSAGIWFRAVSRSRSPRVLLVVLAVASCALNEFFQTRQWTPEVRAWLLLVLGKYGYFSMSTGALLGLLVGIELRRDMQVRLHWWLLGALLVACAAIARSWSVARDVIVQSQYLAFGVQPWRWAMSAGCLLGLLALLDGWFVRVRADSPTAAGLRRFGLLGQLTFPIFILHFWSQSITAAVFTWCGRPGLGLAADCVIVAGLIWLMLRATNRLLYGAREL